MLLEEYRKRLTGPADVDNYVNWLMTLIAADGRVLSLVPESAPGDRESRLRHACESLLAEFPDHHSRPDLFAVPVGIKDIINVDGLATQAGSALSATAFAGTQACAVSKLLAKGALVLSKTVTAEFACMEPNATCNPCNLGHTPGGSSSGSAAAVAAGFCPITLGTQTVGSVIRPAAFCGVFGFKASFDRIPTDGILYYSRSTDHVGLIAESPQIMKIAAACLIDDWDEHPSLDSPPRLGIPIGPYLTQADPMARESFETSLVALEKKGVVVLRIPMLDDIGQISKYHNDMTAYEFAREHESKYRRYGPLYRPVSSSLVQRGRLLTANVVEHGHKSQKKLRSLVAGLMDEYQVDALACPAAVGIAPKSQRSTGDPAMNLPWTHAGLPVTTLPAGTLPADGGDLPLGIQLVGRFGEDEHLLSVMETISGFLPQMETLAAQLWPEAG